MRRKNRQVTDMNEIRRIIEECKVARIGMNDEGAVYIVPMNYGCECADDGKLTFYFHCSKVGRKIEILKKNPDICLELDGRHALVEGNAPCSYSYYFASLIGNGRVEFIEDTQDKTHGLKVFMRHQTGKEFAEADFSEKWVNAVCILRVELTDYEVKQYNKRNLSK